MPNASTAHATTTLVQDTYPDILVIALGCTVGGFIVLVLILVLILTIVGCWKFGLVDRPRATSKKQHPTSELNAQPMVANPAYEEAGVNETLYGNDNKENIALANPAGVTHVDDYYEVIYEEVQ